MNGLDRAVIRSRGTLLVSFSPFSAALMIGVWKSGMVGLGNGSPRWQPAWNLESSSWHRTFVT
jgi:hypothetical protein